jgi:hypothetical protein
VSEPMSEESQTIQGPEPAHGQLADQEETKEIPVSKERRKVIFVLPFAMPLSGKNTCWAIISDYLTRKQWKLHFLSSKEVSKQVVL